MFLFIAYCYHFYDDKERIFINACTKTYSLTKSQFSDSIERAKRNYLNQKYYRHVLIISTLFVLQYVDMYVLYVYIFRFFSFSSVDLVKFFLYFCILLFFFSRKFMLPIGEIKMNKI